MSKTKIISTLGPASSTEKTMKHMMEAGMDVARLNFSHGSTKEMLKRIELVRLINRKYKGDVKILGDLQGHRVRIGDLPVPRKLVKQKTIWLSQNKGEKAPDIIPFDYEGPLKDIKNGQFVYIDDGNICLQVTGHATHRLKTKVVAGGLLKPHKGVNIPDTHLEFGGINQDDIRDMLFCAANGVEYIAQSFVRTRRDVMEVRGVLGSAYRGKIIAKIECREGIKNIDHIIDAADGIMIARGDMGVSLPIYEIPIIQKMIIRKCTRAGKFVITATQMLESMVGSLRPTRAEVADVANAVIDGTNFVMLSAESAVGKYPVETIAMMKSIIRFTENYLRMNMATETRHRIAIN